MLALLYTEDKLRELGQERASVRGRAPHPPQPPLRPRRTPFLRLLALRAGRALRRLGAGLETWGGAASGATT
ncbi:MAG TPA: hypothetical protein VNM43_00315 [Dehalococcoidia bacterium]|nr:hypothetical protein [Dehalococcoidia bacterium]